MNNLILPLLVACLVTHIVSTTQKLEFVKEKEFNKLSNAENNALASMCGIRQPDNLPGVPHLKINGGKKAENGQFPWTVSLWLVNRNAPQERRFTCSGTLISDRHVITAAHCISRIDGPVDIYVTAGGTCNYHRDGCRKQRFEKDKYQYESVTKVVAYPTEASINLFANNIAFLELEKPINFLKHRSSVACLPRKETKYPPNAVLYNAGFGKDESGKPSADLRYLRTQFTAPKTVFTSLLSVSTPVTEYPRNDKSLGRVHWGDCGSGLLLFNETNSRIYSIGALSHVNAQDAYIAEYTDYRPYLDIMCEYIGVCYMNKPISDNLLPF